jgi:hypothetical protein
MKILNDIEKQFYNTVQFMKDTASETVQKLINSGEIDFTKSPKEVTTRIVAAMNLSIEQGFLQSSRNLKKAVEKLIKEEIANSKK